MRIVPYTADRYAALVDFLRENWAPVHPLYDPALFDWQYKLDESEGPLLLLDGDRVEGFLGYIPEVFVTRGQEQRGAFLATWAVSRAYQNSGLGILLVRELQKQAENLATLGIARPVVPLYQKMGFSHSPALHRYVIPLDAPSYLQLLKDKDVSLQEIEPWAQAAASVEAPALEPQLQPDTAQLAQLYEESIGSVFALSRKRDATFWEWRYLQSAGYRYRFFGDPKQDGVIVARVERVLQHPAAEGLSVLRIIEVIPRRAKTWDGVPDEGLQLLLRGVLSWARAQGCAAADFQCSNNRLLGTLEAVGFAKQTEEYGPPHASLAGLFQPFREQVSPINLVWKVSGLEAGLSADETYFVKSDGDMDRPNIWPLPEDWR